MAEACDYEQQLRQVAAAVADGDWSLVFQSRSGHPDQPWLGPDIDDAIRSLPAGTDSVIVVPIGFVSDHFEVVYDLDRLAAGVAAERGIRCVRVATPGTHPAFVAMVGDLMADADRLAPCPAGHCPPAAR
jgi:ferrochelatase